MSSRVAIDAARARVGTSASAGERRRARERRPLARLRSTSPMHPAEIDERITDRRLLPVDDRDELDRQARREHHVVELVVAVDHGRRLHRRRVRLQASAPRRRRRATGASRSARADRASAAPGVRDSRRACRSRRGRPPASRTRGCRRARRPARTRTRAARRRRRRTAPATISRTTTPSTGRHQIEGHAEHVDDRRNTRSVPAPGTAAPRPKNARSNAELARHVVRGRRQRRARRPPQHERPRRRASRGTPRSSDRS